MSSIRYRGRYSGLSNRAIVAVLLGVFIVFFALPIVWMLLAVTKTQRELINLSPFSFGSFRHLADNASQLFNFQGGAFGQWLVNSALYSLAALVITLIVSIPAGYALAFQKFRLRGLVLSSTLIIMLIPSTAMVLPIFLEMNKFGLIGKPLSVILPFSFFPFGVYLTYIYFNTTVSRDLLDAARIDGCTEARIFFRIAAPLSMPIVALVAFFNFAQNWNNYFLPFVMLPSSSAYTVQVGLSSLINSTPAFNPTAVGAQSISLPTLALAGLLSVLPVLVIFLFAQRFLVKGLTSGSTKG